MSVASDRSKTVVARVVVPARNEEALISRCLAALGDQTGLETSEYEIFLVLDGCTDLTEKRARDFASRDGYPAVRFLYGPGRGVGIARSIGMDAAYRAFEVSGDMGGLISSTDADSTVAPDWLAAQLELVRQGAGAVGGRVELEDGGASLPEKVLEGHMESSLARYGRLLDLYGRREREKGDFFQEHWQFSGASMSLTAEVYGAVGGLDTPGDLEDEYLERKLERHGVRIARSSSVRVFTSARMEGRAARGLARDLSDLSIRKAGSESQYSIPADLIESGGE